MLLSVVVPTRNRAAKLERALHSLSLQSLPPQQFDVIVVDNGGTDNTAEKFASFQVHFPNWKLARQPLPGPAAARNAGAQLSQAELLLFLDDDVIASPGLLQAHLEAQRQFPGCAVLGKVRNSWTGDESPFHRTLARRHLFHSFEFADPENVPFAHFYSCNLSLPRSALLQLGGFDERFPSAAFEDTDLGYRWASSGRRLVFCPEAGVTHDPSLTCHGFAGKRFAAGQALCLLLAKHPELEETFLPSWWRRLLRSSLGFVAQPLAGLFDRPLPRAFLPALAEFCWFYLEYRFWAGYRQGRAAPAAPQVAPTTPSSSISETAARTGMKS
ncbi:MAG: glycosyltransferase family 2 protein [Chlamydiota bacterium]